MAYTNVDVRDRNSERRQRYMEREEINFWKGMAEELQEKLGNIPRAIRQYGYVELMDGSERVTLIEKPPEKEA